MAILLRILLIALPILLVIVWLRWRAKRKSGEEITDSEVRKMRIFLVTILIALASVGVGLKMSDESGDVNGVYVPARVEDGKLIPGHFKPADTDENSKKNSDDSKPEAVDNRD